MAVFNEPTQWTKSLVNSGDANAIPDTTPAGSGDFSFEDGFPAITQVPLGAGGIAPDRKDFNGAYKILGDWVFYNQNGGIPSYNNTFDYVIGRVVLYNDNLYKCIQANGASSTIVAPDSVSPLGSDYWVQVATLADFANFANIDLSNLSATGQALFTNKADKDFSNVTAPVQAFKNMSVGWGLPDYSSGIDIKGSLSTSATSITLSSDGYLQINIYNSSANSARRLYIDGALVITTFGYAGTNTTGYLYPIKKGTYSMSMNDGLTTVTSVMFYPCKGAN